jgi:hypothetical protein
VVGLELVVVAVLNLAVHTGKGAPAHPQTALQAVGLVAALAYFGVLQVKNRTLIGFSAIAAAFFVTLPRVPNSLTLAHILALAVPVGYALIITQRQRKAANASLRAARRGGRGPAAPKGRSGETPVGARGSARRAARTGVKAAPSGPRPSSRYTPPKAKRGR